MDYAASMATSCFGVKNRRCVRQKGAILVWEQHVTLVHSEESGFQLASYHTARRTPQHLRQLLPSRSVLAAPSKDFFPLRKESLSIGHETEPKIVPLRKEPLSIGYAETVPKSFPANRKSP